MNKHTLIALSASLAVGQFYAVSADPVCHKCDVIREENKLKHNDYEYYDDYLKAHPEEAKAKAPAAEDQDSNKPAASQPTAPAASKPNAAARSNRLNRQTADASDTNNTKSVPQAINPSATNIPAPKPATPPAQQGGLQQGSLQQGALKQGSLQQGSLQQGSLQQGSAPK